MHIPWMSNPQKTKIPEIPYESLSRSYIHNSAKFSIKKTIFIMVINMFLLHFLFHFKCIFCMRKPRYNILDIYSNTYRPWEKKRKNSIYKSICKKCFIYSLNASRYRFFPFAIYIKDQILWCNPNNPNSNASKTINIFLFPCNDIFLILNW